MKHKFKIFIVFVLILVLVLSSFVTSYAVMPVVVGAVALTNAQAVSIALGSFGLMALASDFGKLTGELLASPIVLGIEFSRWRQGYYEKNGDYVNTVSIPKEDLDKIYNAFLQVMGGYGKSSLSNLHPYFNLFPIDSVPNHVIAFYNNVLSDYPEYPYKNIRFYKGDKFQVQIYKKFNGYGTENLQVDGPYYEFTFSSTDLLYFDSFYNKSGYTKGTVNNYLVTANHNISFNNGWYYSFNDIRLSPETWDSRYNNPQGINYEDWEPQTNNYYTINLPTTIEDGERVLDLDRLYTLSPEEVRNSERVTEIENAPPIELPDPYAPTPPITNPIPDPIANIGTDTWLDRLWSKFVDLWVLPDSYFIDNFTRLQSQIPMLAFPNQIINDLKNIANLQGGNLEDIWIDGFGGRHKVVDFQFLRDALPYFHNMVRGIMFIMLLLYNYNQVYKLIRGNSYGFSNTFRPNESSNIEKGGKA